MKRTQLAILPLLLLFGCSQKEPQKSGDGGGQPEKQVALPEARRGFTTKLLPQNPEREPVAKPPAALFRVVQYESPAGKMAAYLSKDPADGKKHPAIIWIFGGFGNDIGDTAWKAQPANNDQSASAFRKAGIVMMYPSLRGGTENPGSNESFFGEVDDVLAAADFLAKQDFVDPNRIYLGGHSTGGTLVLLVAASSSRFRAVFSFGPTDDVAGYGAEQLTFDTSNKRELELRSPKRWLHSIQSPVFVLEGDGEGNVEQLQLMSRASRNPLAHFHMVKGGSHFSILAPMTRLIAGKILRDDGPKTNIEFTEQELVAR